MLDCLLLAHGTHQELQVIDPHVMTTQIRLARLCRRAAASGDNVSNGGQGHMSGGSAAFLTVPQPWLAAGPYSLSGAFCRALHLGLGYCVLSNGSSLLPSCCRVHSVEALLSALEQSGVDNARIEIEGGHEIPVVDGSAMGWVIETQKAGLVPAPIKDKASSKLDRLSEVRG